MLSHDGIYLVKLKKKEQKTFITMRVLYVGFIKKICHLLIYKYFISSKCFQWIIPKKNQQKINSSVIKTKRKQFRLIIQKNTFFNVF